MKKTIIIGLVIVGLYLLINQVFINTYDGATFSNNKSQSIKDGYFLADYIPNKDSVQLLQKKIKSPYLWIEQGQKSEHVLIFFSRKRAINDIYNIIADSAKKCDSNEYLLDLGTVYQVLNCIEGLGYVYKVSSVADTIKVRIKQGSLDVGWQKEIIIDSLIYVKKK